MKNLRKAELAVIGATLLILCFTAGYFIGRNSGAHTLQFEQLQAVSSAVAGGLSTASPAASAAGLVTDTAGRLNINTATLGELDALPGIGPVLAQNILTYRQKHGTFASIEQLRDVDGIGDKKFEALKNLITVEQR